MLSKRVIIAFTVIPMTTAFASVLGSCTILAMIFKSAKKFTDPYRRLIFGISFFDLMQSLAIFLKIWKTTPEQPNAWISLGNQTSCNFLGWVHFAGLNGGLLYSLSLNIYYLCLVRYNMTARHYRTSVEPFLHAIPIVWAIITSTTILLTGHYNPAYPGECLIAPYPVNCLKNPDVTCIRGERTNIFRLWFRVIPTMFAFIFCLYTLGLLWWTIEAQEIKMNKYRMSLVSLRLRTQLDGTSDPPAPKLRRFKLFVSKFQKRRPSGRPSDGLSEAEESSNSLRRSGSSTNYRRKRRHQGRCFLEQARWYAAAFLVTHFWPIGVVAIEWGGNKPPFWWLLFAKFFVPLQGVFNILVYTRPHVKKFRQRNPSVSYMAAFKKVVSSGGDCDEDETLRNRFRRGSAAVPRRASMSSRSSSSGGKKFLAPPFFADGFNAYRQKFRRSARRSSVAFNFDVSSQDPSTLKTPADHDPVLCIDGEKDPVTADGKVIDSGLALEARPSLADEQQQFSAPQNLDLEAIVALHGASADKKQVEEKGDSVLGALDEVDSEVEARPSLADEQQQVSAPQDLDLEAIGELHGASAEKKQVKEKADGVMGGLDEVDLESRS